MTDEEIIDAFGFHPGTPDVMAKYDRTRFEFLKLALYINTECPDSREKSLALTTLQQAQMWSIASIAIHETPLK